MVAEAAVSTIATSIANLRSSTADEKQARFEAWAAIQTTSDITVEWRRCRARFAYYLRYVKIRDVNKGVIDFQLWGYLIEIADDWQTGESFIEGKSRQLGYSTIVAAYMDWIGTFRDYARMLSFSIGQRECEELLAKVVAINEDLPDWLRIEFVHATKSKSHIEWEGTHAELTALPSRGQAGRSYTATLVVTDEWAFHENAEQHYSAYRPAIADGGQHIGISTGNGKFNIFYRYFVSKSPTVPYNKRFNGWRSRPDRDDAWYERERQAFLVQALDPESDEFGKHPGLFKRENPTSIDEMFEVFIGLVYDVFSDATHVRMAPFEWREAKYRVAGIDPGQGDPFAIVVIGENEAGHAHQFGEFYKDGVVSEQDAADYLIEWWKKAPFDAIFVDGVEGTLIATLQERLERTFHIRRQVVHAANKERKVGIGHVYGRLFANTFTVEPSCRKTINEYHGYQFAKVRKGQQEWATSTPEGHHGDAMDGTRYALIGLAKGFAHMPLHLLEEAQPDWTRLEKSHPMVAAVREGGRIMAVVDAGVSRKRRKPQQPQFRRPSTGRKPTRGLISRSLGTMGLRGGL